MPRPTPLSGYPEWLPAQRAVEQQVIDLLRGTLSSLLDTRITRRVEALETLLLNSLL